MLLLIRRIACCCWIGVRLINPGSGGEWKEEWSAKRKRERNTKDAASQRRNSHQPLHLVIPSDVLIIIPSVLLDASSVGDETLDVNACPTDELRSFRASVVLMYRFR